MGEQSKAVSRGGVALLLSIRKYLATALTDQFEQLPKVARGANLIIGAGVQTAAASTAEIYGIPYRYVIYCPTLLPSPEHPPVFLPLPHSTPRLNRRLWSLARIGFNRGMRPALNRHRSAMGLAPVSDLLDHLLSTRPVVAADPLLGALPARCPPPVRRRTLTADVLADTITATLDNELVAERAQILGGRLRKSLGL